MGWAGTSTVLPVGMVAGHAHQLLPQRCQSSPCLGDQDLDTWLTAVLHFASFLTVRQASRLILLALPVTHKQRCCAQGHCGLCCSNEAGHAHI